MGSCGSKYHHHRRPSGDGTILGKDGNESVLLQLQPPLPEQRHLRSERQQHPELNNKTSQTNASARPSLLQEQQEMSTRTLRTQWQQRIQQRIQKAKNKVLIDQQRQQQQQQMDNDGGNSGAHRKQSSCKRQKDVNNDNHDKRKLTVLKQGEEEMQQSIIDVVSSPSATSKTVKATMDPIGDGVQSFDQRSSLLLPNAVATLSSIIAMEGGSGVTSNSDADDATKEVVDLGPLAIASTNVSTTGNGKSGDEDNNGSMDRTSMSIPIKPSETAQGNQLDSTPLQDTNRLLLPGPLKFHDIVDSTLRRPAQKLYKRLNYDPRDRCHNYNDSDVCDFLEEHPDTAAIRYDFRFFSGHLLPLSVLCTLGASSQTIDRAYHAYPPAMDECDPWIGTPLHYACAHKAKSSIVRYLLSQNARMLQQKNQFGRTPLHMACLFKASSKVVSLLLEEEDPGVADALEKDGYTPLHLACENGSSADVIKLLIGNDSNDNIAAKRCLAVTYKDSCTPLHLACRSGANQAVVKELLSSLPSKKALEMLDAQGYTPLHIALQQQASVATIELLIAANSNVVETTTGRGFSVLSLAKHSNASEQVLQLLMAA